MKYSLIIFAIFIYLGISKSLIKSGLNDEQRQALLDQHNIYRQKIASGQQLGHPSASNMKTMNWDYSLEASAQKWADKMIFSHSNCESGENLAINGSTIEMEYNPKQHIDAWYKEISYWDTRYIDRYQFFYKYGHFTQIIWAQSNKVGCGYSYFQDGYFYTHYTVCQYLDRGNYIRRAVYKRGPQCSDCGMDECDDTYDALCGKSISIIDTISSSSRNIVILLYIFLQLVI